MIAWDRVRLCALMCWFPCLQNLSVDLSLSLIPGLLILALHFGVVAVIRLRQMQT